MDARLQRRVQRYGWDKATPHYETYWAQQLAVAQQRVMELAAIAAGARVLDVACGTGLVTFPAALAAGPTGHVSATDLSEAMVERLREEAARRGVANIDAHRMDAEALEYPGVTSSDTPSSPRLS